MRYAMPALMLPRHAAATLLLLALCHTLRRYCLRQLPRYAVTALLSRC